MDMNSLKLIRKTGQEPFSENGVPTKFALLDYWSWAHSDLIVNTERGKIAEFIVSTALGVASAPSTVWDSFDLLYEGKGIEVKSSAYLQSWEQTKYSYIEFTIAPTRGLVEGTGTYKSEVKRQSDAYVFCHFKSKDTSTANPLDLDQWDFYIVPTKTLNKLVPTQKKMALSFFAKHGFAPYAYHEIRAAVDRAIVD